MSPAHRRRAWRFLVGVVLSTFCCSLVAVGPAGATPARILGSGSTYVGLAMQQWTGDAQTRGLDVTYSQTGSPDGLNSFANGLTDFAGTEAEFSALSAPPNRSFQYVPSVAGAIAVMYNASDKAGRKIEYLHLSMRTIARIFMGDISRWSDPAISADNLGLELPDEQITVVFRSGQSGTTALFYDFVANAAPDIFGPWAARNRLPTNVRIIQLDSTPTFAPKTIAFSSSDQIAAHVASDEGRWSIAYDEFGYAKLYNASTAWVQNASGNWVLPYAQNISAALESAQLRDDFSQELSGVYASGNPEAYPISAYSYIVTQCSPDPSRPSCRGPYANPGVAETLAKWLRYIACDGQVNMARIGYSPLPPNLSQEVANAIGRMQGSGAEGLNADNCANPRFRGSLGEGASSPKDPLANVSSLGSGPGGADGGLSGGSASSAANGQDSSGASSDAAGSAAQARGAASGSRALSGGSDVFRDLAPVAYSRVSTPGLGAGPLVALVLAISLPIIFATGAGRRRKDPGSGA